MAKIKVALIGAGGWGRNHARAYAQNPNTELCCIVGRTLERTRMRAEEFHVPFYLDVDEMLEKEKPDFVGICLPGMDTYDTTMKIIRAGIPLLVEKPLAYELEDAKNMIREAESKNLFFGIDFNQRFSIPSELAYQAVTEGKIGEINYIMWKFCHGWAGKMKHPYTNIIEAQCHGLNYMEAFCGPIDSIMAEMTDKTGIGGYSTFALAVRFQSGAVGSMMASFDAADQYPLAQEIEINGSKGRIRIEDNAQKYSCQTRESPLAETWGAGFFMDQERVFSYNTDRVIGKTISAFLEGKQPPVPAREGLRALELAYCAIESFEKGVRVKVPAEIV